MLALAHKNIVINTVSTSSCYVAKCEFGTVDIWPLIINMKCLT